MTSETAEAAMKSASEALIASLGARPGADPEDVKRGVTAAAKVWSGSPEAFVTFGEQHYAAPGADREVVLAKMDRYLGQLFGELRLIQKEIRWGLDVDEGPLLPVDTLFAGYAPAAHVQEDLRRSGIATAIQLNFGGLPDDPEDLTKRSQTEWAALVLGRIGIERVPADLRLAQTEAKSEAEALVNNYNLLLDKIDFGDPTVVFPPQTRLISHWGLRDYMTNLNGSPGALPKQRAILELMEDVVRGRVPQGVLDNDAVRWQRGQGTVLNGRTLPAMPEGSRRWSPFQKVFQVQRKIDNYTRRPNLIQTRFLEERQMTEERVEAMLVAILSSPLIGRVARYVESRLGRPIQPFDIYFHRFQPTDSLDVAALDEQVRGRYPTRNALQADLPAILMRLGWDEAEAKRIAGHIRIDPSRSAGHAWPPETATDKQLLRMRVPPTGVDWQEFGTFMHELGHCVEGILAGYDMDYRLLWGVPNTAFSEAFAFTFQDKALDLFDEAATDDPDIEKLQRLWEAFEIAGPALTEMRLFRWLYQNPDASADDIQAAAVRIGDDMWAQFHAPVFGERSFGLMSVYSHMLWGDFYLAEYPIGYIIAYQLRRHLAERVRAGSSLAAEMTRMCRQGAIYPDAWMMGAVGERVSVLPMLSDAEAALDRMGL